MVDPLDAAEDAVLDVLDVLSGWCSPHQRTPEAATAAADRALNAIREARDARRPDDG